MAFLSACVALGGCGTQAQNVGQVSPQATSPAKFESQALENQAPTKTKNANGAAIRLVQTIPLPGVEGRFDHFAV